MAPPGPRASRQARGRPLTVQPGAGTAVHRRRPSVPVLAPTLSPRGRCCPGCTGAGGGGGTSGSGSRTPVVSDPQKARGTFQTWADRLSSKDPLSSAGDLIYFKFVHWGREAGLVSLQSLGGDLSLPSQPGASTPLHADSTHRCASALGRPAPSCPPPWSLTDTHTAAPPRRRRCPSDSAFPPPGRSGPRRGAGAAVQLRPLLPVRSPLTRGHWSSSFLRKKR